MSKPVLLRWAAAAVVAGATLVAVPASATPAGDDVVINEIYVNGGSAGQAYKNKFVELYNPTSEPVDISTWSLQYRSPTGTGAFTAANKVDLDGVVQPGKTFLVQGDTNSAASTSPALPTPDQTSSFNPGNGGGSVALVRSTELLPASFVGDVKGAKSADNGVVDFVGYGNANTYETQAGPNPTSTTDRRSLNRTSYADTDSNSADITLSAVGDVTPLACGETCKLPTPDPYTGPIAGIQGTGSTSPVVRAIATTKGVVTAVYRTGGFSGAYIQTPGTGGPLDLSTHTASDGIFVFGSAFAAGVGKGDYVQVSGKVVEFQGMTEINASTFSVLTEAHDPVTPAEVTLPTATAQKESLEGMLVAPQGAFTVTNNYATNQYGEIGLAPGTKPFDNPTNVVAPGAAANALAAQNAARLVTLDDGSTANFLTTAKDTPVSWLRPDNEVRTGAPVTFDDAVVLDFRNGLWKLQPTAPLTAATEPVTFGSTRTAGPKDVGGAIRLATFNVLNYFPTTGVDYVAAGGGNTCTYYTDRAGAKVTTNECGNPSASSGNGPRGAAEPDDLARQQAKIVKAINTLDADVVSLEEIENSAKLGQPRDTALQTLVTALNAQAGAGTWAFVPSPAVIPTRGEDVIRTAFIYKPAALELVGASTALDDPAFSNARAPLAQAFRPVGGKASDTFAVVVNHFKSKGSGEGANADQGDGQGASNLARKQQATALLGFVDQVEAAAQTRTVFLSGDFNAYNEEDPVKIIEAAGFVNVAEERTDKQTYQFDGAVGSLDHVFASPVANAKITGADIWNINAYESVAREYSRANYNATDLYAADPYRASDHDPEIVGFDPGALASTVRADAPHSVRAGEAAEVEVSVDSTVGTPMGSVTVEDGATVVGQGDLADGKATISLDPLSIGSHELTVTYAGDDDHAADSTTVVVRVLKAEAGLEASVGTATYGTSATLHVTGPSGASGLVYVGDGDDVVGVGSLSGGEATITLDRSIAPGDHRLDVYYAGNASYEPERVSVDVTVDKAPTTTKKTSSTSTVVKNRTKAKVSLSVTATGFTVEGGTVTVSQGSTVLGSGTVTDGKVTVTLKKFTSSGTKSLKAVYSGDTYALGSSTSFSVVVRKK